MKAFRKHRGAKDLREQGRIILAHGEVTGHAHEVLADTDTDVLPAAEYFEEPDGRRVLLVIRPCILRHQEHALVQLAPADTQDYAQGDVYLRALAPGCWHVIQQAEELPEGWRSVAD
mgnify:CR=1 FL=1